MKLTILADEFFAVGEGLDNVRRDVSHVRLQDTLESGWGRARINRQRDGIKRQYLRGLGIRDVFAAQLGTT